jgi:CheY-like chemotaxis protein
MAALPPLDILLAEDNPVNVLVARGLLERGGHRVIVATDGRQAVQHAAQARFDLVLMDMQMPELDGLGAARAIRRLPGPVAGVPIIALTANAMPGDAERCLAAGMNAHVAKPIDPPELFAAMAALLGECGPPVPTIDAEQFRSLAEHLGADAMAELAQLFRATGRDSVDRLCILAGQGNLAEAAQAAHDLKGMAGYWGAARLAGHAQALEQAAHQGDLVRLRGLCAGLDGLWQETMTEVERGVA